MRSIHLVPEKTGALERVAAATSIANEEFGSKGAAVPTAFTEDLLADIVEGEDYSDEDDNINDGLVHYCDGVTFSQGGVRSRSVEHPERAEEAVYKDKDDSMNHTRIVKRTMNEILGIGCEDEPPKKRPGRPRSEMKKQMQGLRLSRNGTVRQTVPAMYVWCLLWQETTPVSAPPSCALQHRSGHQQLQVSTPTPRWNFPARMLLNPVMISTIS